MRNSLLVCPQRSQWFQSSFENLILYFSYRERSSETETTTGAGEAKTGENETAGGATETEGGETGGSRKEAAREGGGREEATATEPEEGGGSQVIPPCRTQVPVNLYKA